MTTAVFTTVENLAVGDVLTESRWDNLADDINQLASAHRNLLTNGGFEVWQRGAGGFTSTTNAYTADRWQINWGVLGGSGTTTVTQETSIVDAASVSSLKAVVTATVAPPGQIIQKLEDFAQLRGKTVSFSIRVRQSVASAVTPWILDTATYTNGATVATTGSFVTLTVSAAIGAASTGVTVGVNCGATGTYYLDDAMLVIGPAPAPYRPLHPQEDLARCQRYYETMGAVASTIFLRGYQAAGTLAGTTLFFRTSKGGTPTVTKNGTWGVTNCGQPAVGAPSTDTCNITSTVTALGDFSFTTNSTDDTVTIEFNP